MGSVKSRSLAYWKEIKQARELARAKKLATGELVIGLNRNGKPITLPRRGKE